MESNEIAQGLYQEPPEPDWEDYLTHLRARLDNLTPDEQVQMTLNYIKKRYGDQNLDRYMESTRWQG